MITASALTAAFVGAGVTSASAIESDDSESLAQVISSDLLNDIIGGLTDEELLDVGVTTSGNPSDSGDPDGNFNPLNVSALGLLNVSLPTVNLPLLKTPDQPTGLLDLGNAGLVNSYGHSPSATSSKAAAGVITADGAINIDGTNTGSTDFASVNLIDLLDQLELTGVTDAVVDELSLNLGALASSAEKTDGTVTSDYVVAGADINVSSPLVGGVITGVSDTLTAAGTTLNGILGESGIIAQLVSALEISIPNPVPLLPDIANVVVGGSEATIGINGLDTGIDGLVTSVFGTPLSDANEIVTIDFQEGTVLINLANVVDGGSLNGLDPNTILLDDAALTRITTAVSGVLDAVTEQLTAGIDSLLNSVEINIDLPITAELAGLELASGNVTLQTTIADLRAGTNPTFDIDLTALGAIDLDLVTNALTGVLSPLLGGLFSGVVDPLLEAVDGVTGTITSNVINPVLTGLSPVLEALNEVVEITINEQPTELDPAQDGLLGATSFTVDAIDIALLPGLNVANVSLASSTVRALDEIVYDTSITVTPGSIEQGESTSITGEGFAPEETVTITIDGVEVGTVTTDADGTFTFQYTAADDATPGTFDVVATGDVSDTPANGSLEITEPADTSVNANASASAAASANADSNVNGAAEAAAEAAAFADATAEASAAANADASAAAESAATADASTAASADASTDTNAAAQASATAAAQADNTSTTAANASAATDANATADANSSSASAAQAASTANSSTEASATAAADVNADADADADVDTNANASASASASANADDDSNAAAQVAAQAAAQADASTTATAAANADASAAAESAANADASTTASADATTETNAAAQSAAQAAAQTDATSTSNADASSAAEANAAAAASAASNADSSSTASSTAAADVNGDADTAATEADAATAATANTDADADGSEAETDTDSSTDSDSATETDSDSASESDDDSSAAASANASASTAADTNSDADAAATDSDSATTADTNSDADADASESETDSDSASASDSATSSDSDSASDSDTASDSDDNSSASANAASSSTADANASSSSSANSNASSSSNANASADADAKSLSIDIEQPRLQVGEKQTVHGHGFDAGEKVTAVQHSTPYSIGSGVADENGDVTFTWNVPASSELGNHSVELTGETSGSISATFEVYEKKKGDLSPTGGDMALPLGGAAALLMIAGAGVWFATSRRRSNS